MKKAARESGGLLRATQPEVLVPGLCGWFVVLVGAEDVLDEGEAFDVQKGSRHNDGDDKRRQPVEVPEPLGGEGHDRHGHPQDERGGSPLPGAETDREHHASAEECGAIFSGRRADGRAVHDDEIEDASQEPKEGTVPVFGLVENLRSLEFGLRHRSPHNAFVAGQSLPLLSGL